MFETMLPLFLGMFGPTELIVVLLVVVLLFGADKLPKLARSTGEAMGEFHKGREAIESEIRGARDSSLAKRDEEATAVEMEPVTEPEPATAT